MSNCSQTTPSLIGANNTRGQFLYHRCIQLRYESTSAKWLFEILKFDTAGTTPTGPTTTECSSDITAKLGIHESIADHIDTVPPSSNTGTVTTIDLKAVSLDSFYLETEVSPTGTRSHSIIGIIDIGMGLQQTHNWPLGLGLNLEYDSTNDLIILETWN